MNRYLKTIKLYIFLSIVFSLIEAVVTSALLLFPGWLVDNYANGISYILNLVFLYITAFMLYLVTVYIFNRITDYRRIKFEKAIKKDFFNAAIERDFQKYHEYDIQEYISMQANDINEICQNYLSPLFSIFRSIILIATFGIVLVIFVHYYIACLIIVFSIAVVFIPNITAKTLAKRNKAYLDEVGKYSSDVSKMLNAHDILDTDGKSTLKKIHSKRLDFVLAKNMDFRRVNSFAMVLNGGSVEFISVIVFCFIALLLINGRITVGMATIAFTYSTKFIEPMYELNVCLGKVLSVKKAQEKLLKIIDGKNNEKKESVDHVKTISITGAKKEYPQVLLKYSDRRFQSPFKYLITGENGAGKSVFLKLLMKFEELDDGEIMVNESTDIDMTNNVCYVPQNAVIFNASYEDNVTIYGTYKKEKLPFYESFFPSEVVTHIKSNADLSNLSGGEKQVVSFIRALCSEKEVLMMDEPFSAMNKVTIDYFFKNFKQIRRMMLIVSHNTNDYKYLFDEVVNIERKN